MQHTFVINLPERQDRRHEVQNQLSAVGWDAEFFPAERPIEAAGFESIGARGCFLSHLGVLREAQKRHSDLLLILEDDLNFSPDFAAAWPQVLAQLQQKDWSIFYPAPIEEMSDGLSLIDQRRHLRCTHFVVINGPAIPVLISGLETILSRPEGHPLGGPMHVDGAYSTLREQNATLKTFAYAPALGYQRSSRSDIAKLSFFDRAPILRGAVSIARKVKRAVLS